MKTIISKAAPQDGLPVVPHQQEQLHHQQHQINQALNTFETLNDRSKFSILSSSSSSPSSDSNLNRFTDFHLSPLPYGSEVVNKIAPPPSSSFTTVSTTAPVTIAPQTSTTANRLISSSASEITKNVQDRKESSEPDKDSNSAEAMILDRDANRQYNSIIKHYINNLLSNKNVPTQSQQQQQQQQSSTEKLLSQLQSSQNIRMLNLPMKNLPSAMMLAIKKQQHQQQQQQQHQHQDVKEKNGFDNKKFKIIKEFRISLNEIKKELGKRGMIEMPQAASNHNNNGNSNGNTNFMLRPFGSFQVNSQHQPQQQQQQQSSKLNNPNGFSVSGPKNTPPYRIQARSNLKSFSSPPPLQSSSMKSFQSTRKNPEKLAEFSRRSRMNGNQGKLNENTGSNSSKRSYHYMAFHKRSLAKNTKYLTIN
ncbi:hypothetical protein NH340_JMT02144 [Sarcoptes scabiei]|nr:hypothetical protein NH340_JMT02144 [Sarcoptes scabiei]